MQNAKIPARAHFKTDPLQNNMMDLDISYPSYIFRILKNVYRCVFLETSCIVALL